METGRGQRELGTPAGAEMSPRSNAQSVGLYSCWLRTNGVNTNEAAAKVMNFDRLGKKVRPGTFGNIKVG